MDPSIHLIERRERRGKRIAALALLAVIAVLSSSLVGIFAFLETNAAFGTVQDFEEHYICNAQQYDLSFPDLGSLSEVYTSDGVLLGKLTERNSQPVAFKNVPEIVRYAIVAAEDGDFYEHEGIDFRAIARAAVANARSESDGVQGGSTITQQIVKKNFLTEERTIERKICEAAVAAELERRYTKDQILEFYMNSQFFGYNAYGVKAAAQEFFGKELDELSIAEAAAMMVPIRNPSLYNIRGDIETVTARRDSVIEQMEKLGFITAAQSRAAKAAPLETIEHEELQDLEQAVMIAARDDLLNDSSYGLGDTYQQRKQALFGCPADDTECEGGGGLTITVTVDYALQQEANRILRSWFRDLTGPTGAIAMVDNKTGAIRVMASGLDFGEDIAAGQRPYDLATKGRRQAGSAFKPMALVSALENGSLYDWPITLGTWWDYTSPQIIDCGYPCSPEGNIWTVHNAGGGGAGIRTLEQATYLSTNTVFAQVSLAVGPENIVETAHKLGIESPLNPVLSIALGTQSVSPLEMAAAYSTIANFGEKVDSYLIENIEDADGNVLYQHEVERERVLDSALAAAVVRTLEKVTSQGTASGVRGELGRPVGGKTGTAQDYRDVWFMGFIPQYTTAVWVGYPDAQVEMVNFTVYNERAGREQYIARAYGGTVAAPVWTDFMLHVIEDLPVEEFPPNPEGTEDYFRTPTTEVPDVMEMTEEDATDAIYKAGLRAEIQMIASTEPEGTILGQDPEGGTTINQGQAVIVLISTGVPPEMPSFINVPIEEFEDVLAAFNEESGLNLTWVQEEIPVEDPTSWGRIVGTDPPPGALIELEQEITVIVGVPPPEPPTTTTTTTLPGP